MSSFLSNPFDIKFSNRLQRALMESDAAKYAADRHATAVEKSAAMNSSAELSRQKLINSTMQMIERLRTGVEREKIAAEKEKLEMQIPLLREVMKFKGYDLGEEIAAPKPSITGSAFAVPEMGGRSWSDDTGAHWEAATPTAKHKKPAFPSQWSSQQEEELTQQAIIPKPSIDDIMQDIYKDAPSPDDLTSKKRSFLEKLLDDWNSIFGRAGEEHGGSYY